MSSFIIFKIFAPCSWIQKLPTGIVSPFELSLKFCFLHNVCSWTVACMKISIYEKSVRKKNTSFVHCTLTWKWHFHTFYNCFFSIQLSVYLSALSMCKRTEASETIIGSLSLRCGYYYSVSFASIKLCTEAHVPTLRYDQYVKHAHNHITPAVEAMDSCFALIRARQHGIAVGSMSWPYRGVGTSCFSA